MEVFCILGIFIIAGVVYYGQQFYFWVTERGKFWTTCYRCHGRGSIRGEGYGTNGVEIWPLYDTCPTCGGRGKVEDYARNQSASVAVKTKPKRRDKKLFGLKIWQISILGGLVILLICIFLTFFWYSGDMIIESLGF